jgi:hypothetical protein
MRVISLLLIAVSLFGAEKKDRTRQTSSYTIGPSIQPMIIFGEGWSQTFTLINVDYYDEGEPTVGTLRFFTRDGQPWKLPLKVYGAVEQVPVNLRSGQMMMLETEVSQTSQQLGWAFLDLSSNTDEWGIYHAFTTYRKQSPGSPDLMTSVPFVDDLEDEWIIPFDNTGGKYPGIAYVNTSTTRDTLTVDVYDKDGKLRKSFERTVPGRTLQWTSLLAEHPDLAGIAGQMILRADGFRAAVLALQFAPNGAFTAVLMVHTYGLPSR